MTDAELVAKKLARIETCLADDEVDLQVVRRVVEHHLGDLEAFVAAIRAKMG